MSSDNCDAHNVAASSCCASCGIAKVDDIKLKECADCDLVRYCSDACHENHQPQHEEDCKKRAAEVRDDLLFKQPDSTHLWDCPICMIPLQLDLSKSSMQTCCSKVICKGCFHANLFREEKERLENKCPFCRKLIPDTDEECDKRRMERVEANDPVALRREGVVQLNKGDYSSAFEYYTKAAQLGDVDSHYRLASLYDLGKGVEKDEGKAIHHLEEAAIGGHPQARYNLGIEEGSNDNFERAVTHFIIAAKQGHDDSIKPLMAAYRVGFVSKEDLAAALRAHQAAVDATKSPLRDVAEEYDQG